MAKAESKFVQRPPRKEYKRSRSGCVLCRAKHLRCDETKPECSTCTSKGFRCPGYQQNFKWSTKHERTPVLSKKSSRHLSTSPPVIVDFDTENEFNTINVYPTPPQDDPHEDDLAYFNDKVSSGWWAFNNVDLEPESIMTNHGSKNIIPNSMLDPILDYPISRTNTLSNPDFLNLSQLTPCAEESTPAIEDSYHVAMYASSIQHNQGCGMKNTPVASSVLSEANTCHTPDISCLPLLQDPTLPNSMFHTSSALIEYWFQTIRPMWAGFEGSGNLFLTIARSSWMHSAMVSNCLQNMSATYLMDRIPQFKSYALMTLKSAMSDIQRSITHVRDSQILERFPSELLLCIFCIGTSLSWRSADLLGIRIFREARKLLILCRAQKDNFSSNENEMLSFFDDSFTYWNALMRIVDDDRFPNFQAQKVQNPQSRKTIVPHPWTGVSTESIVLLGQAIGLCRDLCQLSKFEPASSSNTASGLNEMASELEERVLELQVPNLTQVTSTGDKQTPVMHMANLAEAFRSAALLQLYQAYPSLLTKRLPQETLADGAIPWKAWLIPLTLHLLAILKRVPTVSGTRRLQPLLYLIAATGLKYEEHACRSSSAFVNGDDDYGSIALTALCMPSTADSDCTEGSHIFSESIEIAQAREFVVRQLDALEQTLPPKPVIRTKELIRAIWTAYDQERFGGSSVHWIDVMEESNLHTLFG